MNSLACFGKSLLLVLLMGLAGGAVFIYSGLYPVGADVPHYKVTHWVLETLREQSIARAARDIAIPKDLNSADRLLAGGADYNDMCTGCHLKPGKKESDFTIGLYPTPPNLGDSEHVTHGKSDEAELAAAIRRQFWIIKHGIKASGMPAWGPTHDDERIWNMVAFLQRLPELTPEQYQILTARGDAGHHSGHH